jgi:putative membrane protein
MKRVTPAIFFKGLLMGAADVVPGVSGGTMALITGIYPRLITAIASIGPRTVSVLRKEGLKAAWHSVDGTFLSVLAAGIVTALLSLAHVVGWLLDAYPPVLWAFFFGLILASTVVIRTQVKTWSSGTVVALLGGLAIGLAVSFLSPASTPEALWFVFLSGAIAISAMILPGISGSFLLVLMGKYEFILDAVRAADVTVVGVFLAGILIGLMTGSRIIKVLFARYHDLTLAAVVGIMLGSLAKVWPWKVATETYLDSDGIEQPLAESMVLPSTYADGGEASYTIVAVLAFLCALVMVSLISRTSEKTT